MILPGFGKGGPMKPGLSGFGDKLLDPFGIMPSGVKKVLAPGQDKILDSVSPPPKEPTTAKPVLTSDPVVELNKRQRTALLVNK
jgi:hypothetical protein